MFVFLSYSLEILTVLTLEPLDLRQYLVIGILRVFETEH